MQVSVSKGSIRPPSYLCCFSATGYYVVWSLSRTYALSKVSTAASGCITTFYTLTMFVSLICTGTSIAHALLATDDQNNAVSIAWQIYHTRRFMPGGLAALLPVFIVVIESGALYATSVLALLISFLVGSNGEYIMLDVIPPIVVSTMNWLIHELFTKLSRGSHSASSFSKYTFTLAATPRPNNRLNQVVSSPASFEHEAHGTITSACNGWLCISRRRRKS
jgi:hypothetical protein